VLDQVHSHDLLLRKLRAVAIDPVLKMISCTSSRLRFLFDAGNKTIILVLIEGFSLNEEWLLLDSHVLELVVGLVQRPMLEVLVDHLVNVLVLVGVQLSVVYLLKSLYVFSLLNKTDQQVRVGPKSTYLLFVSHYHAV